MARHVSAWDLRHLSGKYPWLRVDNETVEEFRAPFEWVEAASESASSEEELETDDERGKDGVPKRQHSHSGRYSLANPTNRRAASVIKAKPSRKGQFSPKKLSEKSGNSVQTPPIAPQKHSGTSHTTDAMIPPPKSVLEASVYSDWAALRQHQHETRRNPKKPTHSILSLSLPSLHRNPQVASKTSLASQLTRLAQQERSLQQQVYSQIEAEKAKLPLTFLFERHLDQSYCRQKSVETITTIFAKLQFRLVYSAFQRWKALNDALNKQELQEAALERAKIRALALLDRLASDCYVGTLDRAFGRWRNTIKAMAEHERQSAARKIQCIFRQRRAKALFHELKRASMDRAYKRDVEIQQLLRFERRMAQRHRDERQRMEELVQQSALLIQKRARGMEARRVTTLLARAMRLVEQQQRRRYAYSTQRNVNTSPLLAFLSSDYHQTQPDLLEQMIQDADAELISEDRAVVLLQRHFRGYATRLGFVVLQTQQRERKKLEERMCHLLQRVARGYLARKRVRQLKQKQRSEALMAAYVRERHSKSQQEAWEERYKQEQMTLQLQRLQVLETMRVDAKRDAEVAKWQAEAALYRKQELQAQLEAQKLQDTLKHDAWELVTDAKGQPYYYNTISGESSWERPSSPPKPLSKEEKTDEKPTEDGVLSAKPDETAHDSALLSSHLNLAMHFRLGAALCAECQQVLALRQCVGCDEALCAQCFETIHEASQKKQSHEFTQLELMKEELTSARDAYCIDCTLRKCTRLCNLCGDGFCSGCFDKQHSIGQRALHTWIPWTQFTQYDDWLVIHDDQTGKDVYFNIETKESTHTKPFVLQSGEDRHRALFHEREQPLKARALALEGEVTQLQDKLRIVEEEKAVLIQRPRSRVANASNAEAKPDQGKPRKGKLKSLFSRSKGKKATMAEGESTTTPEELAKQALKKGVTSSEQSLLQQKLMTRSRGEKEAKAQRTIGTKHFEDAMIQQLSTDPPSKAK
ncbi:hypothetical protein Poli38472_009653 [Pythium oligandrum]|uniref:WW domain-containing protein n=1 Tax=Pythium oligandrum TaxID=41045 RepID=A0A8K1FFX7_PYTOL|nr:hypothetical protein Poli38472_009653 [Pythium oligandrum]|eukprot:TMW62160.1 hypothetical protein Poli38472_009653 [Pythium oligandrum]